ncbi:hypothetical protein [Robertmurraya siralis]|uniref:hypothetical protein n=1 Tax=Robertmurraya siralis TaxID=77777 RepID=UPI0010F7836C|nr:hypothetical protein [Robertmurraya siralis]
MARIPEILDDQIFIKANSLTNLIKSKKVRKQLFDNRIKVEIIKETYPVVIALGLTFNKDRIKFIFHHPKELDKNTLNDIIHLVSEAIWKRHDKSQRYEYVTY